MTETYIRWRRRAMACADLCKANTGDKLQAKSVLTKIAAFVADRNIPFLVCSIGMDRDVAVGRQVQNDSARSRGHHPARR